MRRPLRKEAALLGLLLLPACAVGPDYKQPAAPNVDGYSQNPPQTQTAWALTTGGATQRFETGRDIPGQWWNLFGSQPLSDLVEKALAQNPDLKAAEAALKAARENAAAGGAALYPSLSGSAGASRGKRAGLTSAGETLDPYSLYNASVSVVYALDVFGGIRRANEGLEATAESTAFQKEAAVSALAGNVVTAAIGEASLRGQIAAIKDVAAAEKKQLDLLKRQLDLGAVGKTEVLAQIAEIAQTDAQIPPLEKQLAATRNQLAAMAGQFPSQAVAATFKLESMALPEEIPVSLPSQLVAQRPDIRAAAATLHAASAAVGVATAAMLPQFTLSASFGNEAGKIADMFTPGTALWSLGSGIAQPLFRAGELTHKKRASEAQLEQAEALYQSTVLAAFHEVADALNALTSDAESLRAQSEAERAARDSLNLARSRYSAGAISYLTLLNAEKTHQQTRMSLIQAQAKRYADTAALFMALGGGWWNRENSIAPTSAQPQPSSGGASAPAYSPSLGKTPAYIL